MGTSIRGEIRNPEYNVVSGKVTDNNDQPLPGLKVEIFDANLREWTPLASMITGRDGRYNLQWQQSQLTGRNRKSADIAVRVSSQGKDNELYRSGVEDIRFNATQRESIDITISREIPVEKVEFDFLKEEVTYLAGNIAISGLRESKEYRDVTFISKELEVPAEKIEHIIVAHRLQQLSEIDADFFYALLRKNTLLGNNITENIAARPSIGISANDKLLLFDAAMVTKEKITSDATTAINESIVNTSLAQRVEQNIKKLQKFRADAEEYYRGEHSNRVSQMLETLLKPEKLAELKLLFDQHKNDPNTFFERVTDPSFLEASVKTKELKKGTSLGRLSNMRTEVMPALLKEMKTKTPDDLRRMARLNKSEWEEKIALAGSGLKDKKLISSYASIMVRKFEQEYPTTAFAAQLEREKKPVLKNHDQIVSFLNRHEAFDLTKHNVDRFFEEQKIKDDDKNTIGNELKSVQRVFRLIPNYSKTMALRNEKIHSSYNIVATGKKRFINEVGPKAGLSEKEAKQIYQKAETRHTGAMLMIGEMHDSMSIKDVASFESAGLQKKIEAVSKNFPNLKSLFKVADSCQCEHCRSVYSPAAYLVEILQFLDKRAVKSGNAKSVLFGRRPDLGEIDLGCANANTPLKYIDLVCELLEEAVIPEEPVAFTGLLSNGPDPLQGKISNSLFNTIRSAGWPVTENALVYETETDLNANPLPHYLRDETLVCKIVKTGVNKYEIYRLRQTFGTAEELDAAPEYVNEQAYKLLRETSFAFRLPFDLHHTEARAYFNRFDIRRENLMRAFSFGGDPSITDIAMETLGLTESDRKLITETPSPNNNAAQQEIWNVPAPGNVLGYMRQVDQFLDRTGLSYKELDVFLKLEFIDPNGDLFIRHANLTCNTAYKEIENLSLAALDRMHRFLRLQKKTGWKMELLNTIICQPAFANGVLSDACLISASQLKDISGKSGIKIEELAGCFGEIPYKIYDEAARKPLYHQIFLNKAKNGVIDEALLPEKVDGSQIILSFGKTLSTCLQLKEKDLDWLFPLLPDKELNMRNLSFLYAASRLIKKLKIKAPDFALLISQTGLNISAAPSEMLNFIDVVQAMGDSPLKPADARFILKHEADNLADRVITDIRIESLLNSLKATYKSINDQQQSKYNDTLSAEEQKETWQQVLSGLAGLTEEQVAVIVKFLTREWPSAAAAKQLIADTFDKSIDRTQIDTAIDALNAIPAGDDTSAEQKALVKAMLDAIAVFQVTVSKRTALETAIATAFKAPPDITTAVLTYAVLKQAAPGNELILSLLSDDLLNAVTPAAYPKQYASLRLLQKIFYLVTAFKLKTADTEWYLKNNKALGWFELDGVPYDAGQAPLSLSKYFQFLTVLNYATELTPVENPADTENPVSFFSVHELLLTPAITKDAVMLALSLLTGYEKDDLADIDSRLFAAFDANNYRSIQTWEQVLNCGALMRKLGASVAQITDYIKPTLDANDVAGLRSVLKARYDEDTWLSTLKEIMDAIRPQKRNALVAYLLATNPGVKDENDLYEYFLVDVEMEAVMPSSRIVQAHNSIQLFVQRCLMGLEPDALADTDADPEWNQWKWMKNYRVWEANRKIFLYPENWYDVTLADDKSYLLTEFINELQQNELTNDTAEEALKHYVDKLDNISFLEVMATWYDVPTRDMHVFARTKGGDPCIYYYRRFENERYWTPWEKVELDITGDHLLAFKRNNRLHLAWPVFMEEANPDQESTVPGLSDQPSEAATPKPEKRLKIQLAISEYSNKKWQPKRVSRQGFSAPAGYTTDASELNPNKYTLFYFEEGERIWFYTEYTTERIKVHGAFNVTGCKGYPEFVPGSMEVSDYFPDFKDTVLRSQRYYEKAYVAPDDLSVRNAISGFYYLTLLHATPGQYRISFPHQLTVIDGVAIAYALFMGILFKGPDEGHSLRYKIPMGTLLPYFMEDSRRAYVIIPGFYKKILRPRDGLMLKGTFDDSEKRTASDVLQLIDDIMNWFKKFIADIAANPPGNMQEFFDILVRDPSLHDLLREISKYESLDFILNFLIGKTGNPDFDSLLKELSESKGLVYGEQFKNMYHPMLCPLKGILYKEGIPGLMKRETQLRATGFNFETTYVPNAGAVPQTFYKNPDGTSYPWYPIEDVDFTSDGSYSLYNWDLFFRIPLHIATSLTQNQRFEEALTWFHYMFNPTGALPGTGVQKYWVTKPFYMNQSADYFAQRIDSLMNAVADESTPEIKELEFAISEWRNKPFRPDVIARFRPVAYQKALLMKYIDNLMEWGDYLFRQDTMESIAQATQMYILSDKLLGPKPRIVPPVVKPPYETYNQVEAKLDSFGNALIEFENILPDLSVLPEGGEELPASPITLSMLYFCIPPNEQMAAYWDKVADRLFKIRNSQNIDGVERSLALFAPPIDPGMLVKAAAGGMDISAVLAGLNAPTPYYRFNVLSQKATELVNEVRTLGGSLLQALEKKDAESLSLLRNELEMKVLNAVKDVKKLQISEAKEQIEVLKRTKKVTEERQKYYAQIEKLTKKEKLHLDKLEESNEYQFESQIVRTVAGGLRLVPEFHIGASGFGGSPHVVVQLGGSAMSNATSIAADILTTLGMVASAEANRASITASNDRRYDDWKFQELLAKKELDSIDKQIKAAEIRKEISETDLKNHELQIENAKKADEFMRSKYTNKELYTWMIGQIASVYFKSYKLAHDFAKKAERSYRFELGNDDSFISYGYWDSMKKGLQSADHLIHDIKRMETSYLDKNKREYEITRHVSLAQLDPLALVRLRASGVTDFTVPEVLYDMDYPGQYFRRIKSVSISMPCIAGPHTSISAKLSLVNNKYRKNTNADNMAGTGYAEDIGNDERFAYNIGAIQSIAAGTAQNDSGVFELSFKDDRYVPFEGTGAISSWRLELPTEIRQFDYNTIADVIIHVKYTAREGGSSLKNAANAILKDQLAAVKQALQQEGMHVALNMKHELPNEWHLLKQNGNVNVLIDRSRLPYMAQTEDATIESVLFVASVKGNPNDFSVFVDTHETPLSMVTALKLCTGVNAADVELGTPFNLSVADADKTKLDELMMVVKFSF